MLIIRVVCLVYCVFLTVLLLVPNPPIPPHLPVRRGGHFAALAVLALLVHSSRTPIRGRLMAGLLMAYAIATELLQSLVPNRTVELADLIENLLGLAVGTAIWWLVQTRAGRRRWQ